MRVCENRGNQTTFQSAFVSAATMLEENVLLNKALVDASVDIPFICLANNKVERKERIRRIAVNYPLCFLSPLVTLPLTNRLALRYLTKLTPKFFAKESNIIEISNKYLKNTNTLEEGLKKLAQEKQTNYSEILKNCKNDYETLRKKLITAKNAVLSFDFLFSTGSICTMAFLNNSLTKKSTKRDGYSAEFELASKEIVDRRAQKYKKSEPYRKATVASMVGALTILPFILRKGLIFPKNSGLSGIIKKHADKFDYTKGIFMKRLPLFLFMSFAYGGIAMASRNQTELKNNLLYGSSGTIVFFGGDIVINSLLSRFSDKFLKTNIIDKNTPKTLINKLIPKTVPISRLEGKSKKIATVNFFINLFTLMYIYGWGTPHLINKIVRKDLKKDIQKNQINSQFGTKNINMNNFIKLADEKM